MYACLHVCMYACVYVRVCVCTYVSTFLDVFACVVVCVYVGVYAYVYACPYIWMCMYRSTYTYSGLKQLWGGGRFRVSGALRQHGSHIGGRCPALSFTSWMTRVPHRTGSATGNNDKILLLPGWAKSGRKVDVAAESLDLGCLLTRIGDEIKFVW